MTWQKFKLRVRAILARLNLWSAWPLLVGLAIFGAVYFPNTPGYKTVRESSVNSNDPFANLQRLITEDVKTDFTNYVNDFIPSKKLESWSYQIDAIVNLKVDGHQKIVVKNVRVEVLLKPEIKMSGLESNLKANILRRAFADRYHSWLKGPDPILHVNVIIVQPTLSHRAQFIFWSVVLCLAVLLLLSVLFDIVQFLSLKTPKKKYGFAQGEFPDVPGFEPKVVHPAQGTCHVNELPDMDLDELNEKILKMPMTQVRSVLNSIPARQQKSVIDKLKVSDSIKAYLIRNQ